MGTAFGKKHHKNCCCSNITVYPCECRLDTGHVLFGGDVTTSSGSVCEINPISGPEGITEPTANVAWNSDDCRSTTLYTHLVTAFPPFCTATDPNVLSKRVVFIQKLTYTDAPNTTPGAVNYGEWYAAVYNVTDNTLLGVYYVYDLCCHNDTPENAATSHFAWVKVHGVVLGSSTYTVWIYNTITAGTYGNCGWSPI